MNDELRSLIKDITVKGELNKNLVLMTYETDEQNIETIERLSLVYETKSLTLVDKED